MAKSRDESVINNPVPLIRAASNFSDAKDPSGPFNPPDPSNLGKHHDNLTEKALELSENAFTVWANREKREAKQRAGIFFIILAIVIIQFVIALYALLLIGRGYLSFENAEVIMVSFFAAVIIQFIGVLVAAASYTYSERTTEILKVVASILKDAGINNLGHKKSDNNSEESKE